MNKISVFIYSYKSKNLEECINSIIKNSNKENILDINIFDQNPTMRWNKFSGFKNLKYYHIFWDSQTSPCLYKTNFIKNLNSDYAMLISSDLTLNKNWDDNLINFVNENNCIVSGNAKIKIEKNNLFYLKKIKNISSNFELNNYINKELIFFSNNIINKLDYPHYVKYNGEEEDFSLICFINNINIFSCPTNFYEIKNNSFLELDYYPFSLNHNYNEVLDLFKYGKNKYRDIKNNINKIKNFSIYHNFEFDSLFYLPFNTQDVDYDPDLLKFNQIDSRKFVAKTSAIY